MGGTVPRFGLMARQPHRLGLLEAALSQGLGCSQCAWEGTPGTPGTGSWKGKSHNSTGPQGGSRRTCRSLPEVCLPGTGHQAGFMSLSPPLLG